MTLAAALLVGGAAEADAKPKPKKPPKYYASATASGEWQQSSTCAGYNYTSRWQLEGVFNRSRLEPTGEFNMTLGGASGGIDWSIDEVCNGSVETGSCTVALDEPDFILPVFLDKVPGGLRVDFQLSLVVVGCGTAQVAAYGAGFESLDRVTQEPQAFIPAKAIGRKTITVPLSGSDSGTAGGGTRSFSGLMSGTLTLTKKKPLPTVPLSLAQPLP